MHSGAVTGWHREQARTPGQRQFETMHAITAAGWGHEHACIQGQQQSGIRFPQDHT